MSEPAESEKNTKTEKTEKPAKKPRPATHVVVILRERCKLCNICVHFCPVDDLYIKDGKLQQSGKCIGCNACEIYCPDMAIYAVKKEDSNAKDPVTG